MWQTWWLVSDWAADLSIAQTDAHPLGLSQFHHPQALQKMVIEREYSSEQRRLV